MLIQIIGFCADSVLIQDLVNLLYGLGVFCKLSDSLYHCMTSLRGTEHTTLTSSIASLLA